MSTMQNHSNRFNDVVEKACERACQSIAPSWPLDQAIAVNPHWQRINRPVLEVAARMAVLGKIRVFPSRRYQLDAWRAGRVTEAQLEQAIMAVPAARQAGLTVTECVQALEMPTPNLQRLPLLIDALDDDPKRHARLSWRDAITYQVSQTCAAYFDQQQADWQPERKQGLYEFWRDTLTHDHGIGLLMGLPDLGKSLSVLPTTAEQAERWVLDRLGLPTEVWADYLESVLLTVNGWASWCAYLGWQAKLQNKHDRHLRELLAIRLAWGAIVLDCKHDDSAQQAFAKIQASWKNAASYFEQAKASLLIDEVWQVALEKGYQAGLLNTLLGSNSTEASTKLNAPSTPLLQAAFCIDVRSEPLRSALESIDSRIQTLGFAGFFGLPLAYQPTGTTLSRPQLPGLLAPTLCASDQILPSQFEVASQPDLQEKFVSNRLSRFGVAQQWSGSGKWPATAFSYVEAAGLTYLGKLRHWLRPSTESRVSDDSVGVAKRYRPMCRPALQGLGLDDKIALAAKVLQSMGVAHNLAHWVVFVGHGSHTANNPHAASLDCGACCGQTGEVNARVLARLCNEIEVRHGLKQLGIVVPDKTQFVAALHNTTTDEIEWFDLDLLSTQSRQQLVQWQMQFELACQQVRKARAPSLGLDPSVGSEKLYNQLRQRANDGAETRPEWGLANNAAFIIGPREKTRGLALNGRVFLHDYDANLDEDGSLLELLMTAPMLVTHWINWQYHVSTCEPARFGSGNKLLHNVVGGTIGVFEGNGGDLRIGLSEQSVHDGHRFMHEPLRLTVVIDAPAQTIERIIKKHEVVRQLIDNQWLHLWRYGYAGIDYYRAGSWYPLG